VSLSLSLSLPLALSLLLPLPLSNSDVVVRPGFVFMGPPPLKPAGAYDGAEADDLAEVCVNCLYAGSAASALTALTGHCGLMASGGRVCGSSTIATPPTMGGAAQLGLSL
jgi:hypothetical protein